MYRGNRESDTRKDKRMQQRCMYMSYSYIPKTPQFWVKGRVMEVIHIRHHPNNINRDSVIKIPEAWIPTV